MSDKGWGIFILSLWNHAGLNRDQSELVADYESRYGKGSIEQLGKMFSSGVNISAAKEKIIELYNAEKGNYPSRASLNSIAIQLGGTLPPASQLVIEGVKESASQIVSGASLVVSVAAIGYILYLIAISGVLSGAIKKR